MTSQAIDTTSPTWRFIQQHADTELQALRQKNDSPVLDAIATAELRGRIAAWRSLLALVNKPDPDLSADVGGY